jgi:hypothetical protein
MHDITVEGTHTFYATTPNHTAILVHNCGDTTDNAGEAIVHLDKPNAHASISVSWGGSTIHSEQVGNEGTDAVGAFFSGEVSPSTIHVRIPLLNARNAQNFQLATEGHNFGAYDLETRSCVTYCLDVLRAGGLEDVPDSSYGWRKSTLWIFGRDN